MSEVTVRATADPCAFVPVACPLVESDPVMHNVLATNLARCTEQDVRDALWLWLERDGMPVAVAMQVPPQGPYIASDDPAAGQAFAGALLDSGRVMDTVSGSRGGADGFAAAWTRARGVRAAVAMEQSILVLDELRPPTCVAGRFRRAGHGDVDIVNAWMAAFMREAMGEESASGLDQEIADGRVGLWQLDDRPVSTAFVSRPAAGVCRVSGVYTPPALRGRGYASACVAALSRRVLDAVHRCMLYTDLANPTSNDIYTAIGYRRHSDAVVLRFR